MWGKARSKSMAIDIFHASATIFALMASEKYINIVRLKVDSFIWLYAQFQALTFMMYCYIWLCTYISLMCVHVHVRVCGSAWQHWHASEEWWLPDSLTRRLTDTQTIRCSPKAIGHWLRKTHTHTHSQTYHSPDVPGRLSQLTVVGFTLNSKMCFISS